MRIQRIYLDYNASFDVGLGGREKWNRWKIRIDIPGGCSRRIKEINSEFITVSKLFAVG